MSVGAAVCLVALLLASGRVQVLLWNRMVTCKATGVDPAGQWSMAGVALVVCVVASLFGSCLLVGGGGVVDWW